MQKNYPYLLLGDKRQTFMRTPFFLDGIEENEPTTRPLYYIYEDGGCT